MSTRDLSTWRVLSRPECSLCDAMFAELCEWLGESANAIKVQDISGDAALERQYGSRIPVLMIDGEFVCAYHLDRARAAAYLTQ